jgi:hypothetical protein
MKQDNATGQAAAGNASQDAINNQAANPAAAPSAPANLFVDEQASPANGKSGLPQADPNLNAPDDSTDDSTTDDANAADSNAQDQNQELSLDQLTMTDDEIEALIRKDVKNAQKFTAANTQRAQAISEERRQFEAEKEQHFKALDDRLQQINQMMQRMTQPHQQPQPQQAQYQPNEYQDFGESGAPDPMVQKLNSRLEQLEQSLGLMFFEQNVSAKDAELKSKYPDYDPQYVRQQTMNLGPQDLNEVIWKAAMFDKINIDDIKRQHIKMGQEMMLTKIKNIQAESRKIKAPVAGGASSGGQQKQKPPKNFDEARQRMSSASNLFTED